MRDVFVKFRYTEGDVGNALRLRLRPQRKRVEVMLAVLVAILAMAGYQLVYRMGPGGLLWLCIPVVVVGCSLALAWRLVPRALFRRRTEFHRPTGVDASDEGLTLIAGDRATSIAWADVTQLEEDERMFALHHGTKILLVPRRSFRDEQHERRFVALLERFVGREGQASRENRRLDSGKSTPNPAP
jgi:hypothetical protein